MFRLEPDPRSTGEMSSLRNRVDELGSEIVRRTRLEKDLREQKEWLETTLTSIGDAVIATDNDGGVLLMNPVAEELCGWQQANAVGKPLKDVFRIVNEATRSPVENPVDRVIREGRVVGLANRTILIARDKKETAIDDSAAPIIDGSGQVAGVVLVFRDVSEKRKVQELKERLAAIVESSDDIIVSKNLDGIITSWNNGAERALGYKADEIVGQHISTIMPPECLDDIDSILGRIRQGQKVEHYLTKRRRKDGTVIEVSLTVSPIRNSDGQIIGASKVGRDVTERMKNVELQERLAAIVESSDDIIVSKDLDGFIISWNKGAERTLGYRAEEIVGKHVSRRMARSWTFRSRFRPSAMRPGGSSEHRKSAATSRKRNLCRKSVKRLNVARTSSSPCSRMS
jgi:PAS domain S-box-containing protein